MDRFQAISAFAGSSKPAASPAPPSGSDVSVSAVSRQVAELEAHLDARLLNRTTRRLSLTESGRAFHERCVQLLADLEEAEQSANAGTVTPRGTLRLTASITFGARHLAPAIAEFVVRYPADALRHRAVRPRHRSGRGRLRRRGAHRQHRQPEPRRPQGRHDAARLLRGAVVSRGVTASRRSRRTSRRTCASPTNTRRRATSGRFATGRGASATCGSRARCTPTTAASSRRWRSKAWASATSRISSSGRTFAAGDLKPLLQGFAPAADAASMSCTRAGATCRPRSACSPIFWSSDSRPPIGRCRREAR